MKIFFLTVIAFVLLAAGCAQKIDDMPKQAANNPGKDSAGPMVLGVPTPPSNPTQLYFVGYKPGYISSIDWGTATGTVNAGQDTWFELQGQTINGGQSLQITLGTLSDSVMYLYLLHTDPNTGSQTLNLIASDDDGGAGLASKIDFPWTSVWSYKDSYKDTTHGSSAEGNKYYKYLVRVTGYSASQSGTFTIRRYAPYENDGVVKSFQYFIATPLGKYDTRSSLDSTFGAGYVYDSGVNGTGIDSAGQCVWYNIENVGNLTFKTWLGTLSDTVIELWDLRNYDYPKLVAVNDDYGGTYASQLSVNMPGTYSVDRTYFLKVRAYSKYQTGSYKVGVRLD